MRIFDIQTLIESNSFDDPNCFCAWGSGCKDDLILIDRTEVERLWPLDSRISDHDRVMITIHDKIKNHKGKVYYISSDCNINEKYKKWCEIVKFDKKVIPYWHPFLILMPIATILDKSTYFLSSNHQLHHVKPNKNFITLCSAPKMPRLMTISKFFKNNNFDYSFFPFFNITSFSDINDEHVEYVTPKLPYVWNKKEDSIIMKNKFFEQYTDIFENICISDQVKFENDFDTLSCIRELDEFDQDFKITDLTLENIKIFPREKFNDIYFHKEKFNDYLPKNVFYSCCDIVHESYFKDSIFFTEKTWKEYAFKRPFLLLGAKNQNNILKKLGFELYDEIFDYDFDSYDTVKKRVEGFHDQIQKYIDLDVTLFYNIVNELKEKIDYNFMVYKEWIDQVKNQTEYICSNNVHTTFVNAYYVDEFFNVLEYFNDDSNQS